MFRSDRITQCGKFNVEQTINLKSPQSTNNYVFAGWYEDEELTTPINRIYGSSYEGDITIYGLWYPEGTKTYKYVCIVHP